MQLLGNGVDIANGRRVDGLYLRCHRHGRSIGLSHLDPRIAEPELGIDQ